MKEDKSQYEVEFRTDYESDWDIHRNYTNSFDPYEAMLISQVYDSVSKSVDGTKITDSYTTTLAKERADRVMAKLPDGVTDGAGKADIGKAAFMDILRQKWIYPNANSQHPLLEKFNLWQFYSSVYGYMPMFYDWNVSSTGYVGPDCWLWNPRNLVPQQGRISIADMDYVTALTWVSAKYLRNILKKKQDGDGWDHDAVQALLDRVKTDTGTGDQSQEGVVTRTRTSGAKKGICLATRYESGEDGKWITFTPETGYIKIREIDNPHKNGRIPFVVKYSQPLFDSFYGLGDFQRAKPLQFARDGLTNFYFKGIKMNLIPPIVANAYGVQKHTLDYREGGVMLETIPNSIRRLETSTAGLATYQAAQSNLTGSLLSLFGSQNASIPGADSLNPSQGKTPQAINLYSDKEATRDGAETRHLEAAIEQLMDGFNSLIVNIGTETIPVTLFAEDIQDIVRSGMTDIEGLFKGNLKVNKDGSAGDLQIDPAALKGVEYRFNISADSTIKINKDAQRQALENMMDRLGKFQNVFQDDPTIKVEWGKIMEAWEGLVDIQGARDFVTSNPEAQAPAPQAPAPSPTSMQMPGGQVHESGDMVKLFLGAVGNVELQNAILQLMGLPPLAQPTPEAAVTPVDPTVAPDGSVFHDPTIGGAAAALHQHIQGSTPPQMPAPAAGPMVSASGHSFNDQHLGQVAEAIGKM